MAEIFVWLDSAAYIEYLLYGGGDKGMFKTR